jgi:xylulose-5-phosphate/fructose-6-phosphate phosphoketolase
MEEGATTTPFDMVIRNKMSRFDLAILALKNIPNSKSKYLNLIAKFEEKISNNKVYVTTNLKDMDEIENWTLQL